MRSNGISGIHVDIYNFQYTTGNTVGCLENLMGFLNMTNFGKSIVFSFRSQQKIPQDFLKKGMNPCFFWRFDLDKSTPWIYGCFQKIGVPPKMDGV